MSQRYSHLPDEAEPSQLEDSDELLTLEDVRGDDDRDSDDGDEDDYYETQPRSGHDEAEDGEDDSFRRSPLRLEASSFSSSALTLPHDDGDSNRHNESRPFDQDVEHSALHGSHRLQQQTPNAGAGAAATRGVSIPSVPPSSLGSSAPSAAPSFSAAHLTVPVGSGLKKSVSIGDKLAGRARDLAIAQGRKLDAIVRGKGEERLEYVEDHILETLDYDSHEDTMNELLIEKSGALHTNYLLLLKVFMMVLIGFITAMLMYAVSQGTSLIFSHKISATTALIQAGQGAGAFFAFLFINLAVTATASSLVAIIAPHARGGGVAYALSYLNGTNVADYFSPRIVLTKAASLIFTISGGLTLGMEGPFVFIGGGVALLCSNLIDRVFPFFFIGFGSGRGHTFSRVLRNIREERVFVAGGLAAGLAVAFDAPIAGVLFALEGSTTFLTVPVVLRIFGCAMFASFFNDLGHNNFSSEVINHNLLTPTENEQPPWAFSIPEVLPFTVLGMMGGLAGAGATWMNIRMTLWRHEHVEGPTWRDIGKQVLEVALFTFATSTVWFVLPYIFGCRAQGPQCAQSIAGGADRCLQLQCGSGYYSEIGAFVYSSSDEIARLLFDRSLSYSADYHVGPLIVYGLAYWVLVSLVYGAFVPGGLFVPSIVVGGTYGRVVGIFVEYLFPNSYINPGVYALLGASSMLGGFTRLVLPVVLMLIELTGDATYLLPIMYCAMVGKFVADFLFPSLYPQHMAIEKIPTLTDNLNPVIAKLHAQDVMIKRDKIACIGVIDRLSVIKAVLLSSKRVVFPLLTPGGQLVGCISRRAILQAVKLSRSYATYQEALLLEDQLRDGRHLKAGAAAADAEERQWQDWHSATLTGNAALSSSSFVNFEDNWINLKSFCDQGSITAHPTTPSRRLHMIFRRLGISHLCVTDRTHHFLGFVTRRCLIYPPQPSAPQPVADHAAASPVHSSTALDGDAARVAEQSQLLAEEGEEKREEKTQKLDQKELGDDEDERKGLGSPPPPSAAQAPMSSMAEERRSPSGEAKGDDDWDGSDWPLSSSGVQQYSGGSVADEDGGDDDAMAVGAALSFAPTAARSSVPLLQAASLSFAAQHALHRELLQKALQEASNERKQQQQ